MSDTQWERQTVKPISIKDLARRDYEQRLIDDAARFVIAKMIAGENMKIVATPDSMKKIKSQVDAYATFLASGQEEVME